MTRSVDDTKKPALLSAIVDHLVDTPLEAVTFRGVAAALEISTYRLVYHFGDKERLMADIADYIAQRPLGLISDESPVSVEAYAEQLRRNFALTLLPRNIALQRIEFQVQLAPTQFPPQSSRRDVVVERVHAALLHVGLTQSDANAESEELVDSFYGIQLALVTTNDADRAQWSFGTAATHHLERVDSLLRRRKDQQPGEQRP